MAHPSTLALLEAFGRRHTHPQELVQELDRLLANDQMDVALNALHREQPDAVFVALHDRALERACQFVGIQEGKLRGGHLMAFPVVFREGHPPVWDAAFWERLSGFAQTHLAAPTATLAPLSGLIQPTTLPGLHRGAWHALLREAVGQVNEASALGMLETLEAAKQSTHRPIATQSDQVLVLTQRMQLAVLQYDPQCDPHVEASRLAQAMAEQPDVWTQVRGPLPDFCGMGAPQPIRPAFTQALEQHLSLSLDIARQHRGLGPDSPLGWEAIAADEFSVTFVPRSGPHVLDPIRVNHGWLHVVGCEAIDQALQALEQANPAEGICRPSPRSRLN